MSYIICFVIIILSAQISFAAHIHKEKVYQDVWCDSAGGIKEYRLSDGTRVDCVTDNYSIEFDFAPHWAESIGQSLYYAERTGKQPGVVLIMENTGDDRYMQRLNLIAGKFGIKVWMMNPGDVN